MLTPEQLSSALTHDNFEEVLVFLERIKQEVPVVVHKSDHAEEGRSIHYTGEFADERILEECAIDGKLYMGVSPPGQRSKLDEHAWFDGDTYLPRIAEESCISLVARYLDSSDRTGGTPRPLMDFPEIKREVDFLTWSDLNAATAEENPHFMEEFPYVVKAMHVYYPNQARFVREWLRDGMNAKRDSNWGGKNFTFTHAWSLMGQLTEFTRKGKAWRKQWHDFGMEALENDQKLFVSGRGQLRALLPEQSVQLLSPQGQKITFGWISSENPRIGSASRSIGCHLLLQVNPTTGHMQIYSDYRANGGKGINLDRVAYRVQLEEQKARVRHGWMADIITDDPDILCREGFPFWGAVWYYVYGMLLNGSLTRPAVPYSLLEPDFLFQLVQEALIEDGYRVLPAE